MPLANSLQEAVDEIYSQIDESLLLLLNQSQDKALHVDKVLVCSEFIAHALKRYPDSLRELILSGELLRSYAENAYVSVLNDKLVTSENEADLHQQLRMFRRREMVRIAWRDIAGLADLNETMVDLSHLADACVDETLQWLYQRQCQEMGTPCNREGMPQQMVVLGMGKLGAYELNFSSDIDLIFSFPEAGETRDGPRTVSNEQFFIRLGQRLIQAIDQQTADGFVFRVDMRLRPFGDSGALALSFTAMENYYTTHGREWERYAMVKARVIAGDKQQGAELMAMLRPFVYRRYLDYGAYENLREMKAMIEREVTRKGMEDNVKLGPGGIREVEFIGQAFQLIRGGQDQALQERQIRKVLRLLLERGLLPAYVVEELDSCYCFLRDSEHRLQEWRDEQTQLLPRDTEVRERLAYAMGFADWESYRQRLRQTMDKVHNHFLQVFAAPQAEEGSESEVNLDALWLGGLDETESETLWLKLGFPRPTEASELLTSLRKSRTYRHLSKNGHVRMDRLMPLLLSAIGLRERPMVTLERVLGLLEHIAQRTAYLSLLIENPMALSQLVRLCAASPWISTQLSHYPLLLDELLDPRSLYRPPSREALEAELQQRMARVDSEDQEVQMEVLRHFRHSNLLRVAAADVVDAIPLMVVSDHLTDIAEVVLNEVLDEAWLYLSQRHGAPPREEAGERGFAIVAYGKLGGIELGYGSDLDVVFLHDIEDESLMTDGEKPIPTAVFFARLAQRIIHIMTARTPSGQLYEVDTRLRPSGASGLMVTSLDAFARYQKDKAWTWEHQALVRARVVTGSSELGARFDGIRYEVLTRPRDLDALRQEVREMREKMRQSLGSKSKERFDIKQDRGGIADIEFIVQFGVLAWSAADPSLCRYTDNMRILDAFAAGGHLSSEQVSQLQEAYKCYRQQVHRCKLQNQEASVAATEFSSLREKVSEIWCALLEGT